MKKNIPSHATVVRAGKNEHRFFYFVNGKLNTLQTLIEDIQNAVSGLFGFISGTTLVKSSLILFFLSATSTYAMPQDGQSIAGNVQFQQNGNNLNISAATARSIANYRSFSIGGNEKVNFNLPSSSAAILNRVTGRDASQILGSMTSNGRVFLVNPNGIFIGQGANINVGGLFASTLNIKDADFLNNNLLFYKDPDHTPASVVNQGTIHVTPGSFATLVGSAVQNTGTINASLGNIQLAVGDQVKASISDVALVDFKVTESLKNKVDGVNSAIANSGALLADGGIVKLQADLARNVYQQAINQEGMIRAQSVQNHNGVIELLGTSDDQNALVNTTGTLDASGYANNQTGGMVHVLGDLVSVDNAQIDASGNAGGGQVRIGGDYQGGNNQNRNNQGKGDLYNAQRTFVGTNAQILNNAMTTGDGGKTIVWANDATFFNGHIATQGGSQSGNGGFTEISGKNGLSLTGTVDATAAHGTTGQTLLDPFNLTIVNFGGTNVVSEATFANQPTTNMTISASNINAVGATSELLLQANNNLTFNNTRAPIIMKNHTLTGQAGNNITVNGEINAGLLKLEAGNDVNINRNIDGFANVRLTSDAALPTVPNPTVANNIGNINLAANVIATLIDLNGVKITQHSGALTAGIALVMELHGGGSAKLTSPNNNLPAFTVNATDSSSTRINFTNSRGFSFDGFNLQSSNVNLTALNGGAIDQSFGLTANSLALNLVDGGSADFTSAYNHVNTLSAKVTGTNTQNTTVSFRDANSFQLANTNLGQGNLNLTALQDSNITQSGVLRANRLNLTLDGGGDAIFTRADNKVNNLAVNATGPNTANTSVDYKNSKDFSISRSSLADGSLVLTALGGRNITQGEAITGNRLAVNLDGGGSASLTNPDNKVNIFVANASGANTQNTTISFVNGSNLTVDRSSLAFGSLDLKTLKGTITQTGAITGNTLSFATAGGDSIFLTANNKANNFAVNAPGSNVTFSNTANFRVNNASVSQGNLTLTVLNSGRRITQSGAITTGSLLLNVDGGDSGAWLKSGNSIGSLTANAGSKNATIDISGVDKTAGFTQNGFKLIVNGKQLSPPPEH